MIGSALLSEGNGYIDDGVDNSVLKVASSAVLGGTISEIGGGKFANGAVTGAYSMLFNEAKHKAKNCFDKIKTGRSRNWFSGIEITVTKTKFTYKEINQYVDEISKSITSQSDVLSNLSRMAIFVPLPKLTNLAYSLLADYWSTKLADLGGDYNDMLVSYLRNGGKQDMYLVQTTVSGGVVGHSIYIENYDFYKPDGTLFKRIAKDISH